MMLALLSSLLLAQLSHQEPDGGRPETFQLDTSATTAAMLVSFEVGYGDDTSRFGLTAQTQHAMVYANKKLDRALRDELFARGLHLELSHARRRTSFVLSGPTADVEAMSEKVLRGLFSPVIDDAQYARLAEQLSPLGRVADEAELVAQALEPVLLVEPTVTQHGTVGWQPVAVVRQHLTTYFAPANATVACLGFDGRALALPSGGKRWSRPRALLASDVRAKVRAVRDLYVYGYPLETLDDRHAAGLRVLRRLVNEALLRGLRGLGFAYSTSTEVTLNSTFSGLLVLVPAFDAGGLELQPIIDRLLYRAVHTEVTPEVLAELVAAEQREDERLAGRPEELAQAIVRGARPLEWSGEAHRQALRALTAAELPAISSALLVNERKRFFVQFSKALPPPPKPLPLEVVRPTRPSGARRR